MKFMRIIPAALLALMATGCASRAGYETALSTWVGASEATLLSAWGAPDSFYESGSQKYLTYRKIESSGSGPSMGYGIGYGSGFGYGGGSSIFSSVGTPDVHISQCKTTFILEAQTVKDWRYEGNSCRALRLTPEQLQTPAK